MKHAYILIGILCLFSLSACFTVATKEDLKEAKEKLAQDVRAIESAVVDAIPVPIPRDATKEMLGWISDLLILGGAGGAVGVGATKIRNGKKKKTA